MAYDYIYIISVFAYKKKKVVNMWWFIEEMENVALA